jgi:hypothetical protein
VVVPCAAGPVLYFAYLLVRSLVENSWAKAHTVTLLCFILPSVLYLLAWMFRTDGVLRRQHGDARGRWVMLAGAVAGAGFGFWLQRMGDLTGSGLDCALIGVPVGAATVMFLWLPLQVEVVARAKGWLEAPLTWKEGRIPAAAAIVGVYLFSRLKTPTPPSGWPVAFIAVIITITFLQAIAQIQGAINELAIGSEGEARRLAERGVTAEPPAPSFPVPAPAGGSE